MFTETIHTVRLSPFILFRIVAVAIVCLLWVAKPNSQAQEGALKICSETFQRDKELFMKNRPPFARSLFPALDPDYQKAQQINRDWMECVKGKRAPMTTFKTLDGKQYNRASMAGKILVVNFWFMGCAPCVAEMPALNKLVEEYKGKNVLFLGFSTDRSDRLKSAFFEKTRFDFKIVAESQGLAGSFHVLGYPTTYIVDHRGIIRQAWIGFDRNGMDDLEPYRRAKTAIDHLMVTAEK